MTKKENNNDKTQVISRESMKKIQSKGKANKKSKNNFNFFNIFLMIGGATIIIPLLIFGWILLDAANTNGPIFGERFENDLEPAITTDNITNLETELSSISDVENVEINLISATLRVNLDVKDTIQGVYIDRVENDKILDKLENQEESEETEKNDESEGSEEEQKDPLSNIALEAYNKIITNLEKDTYFTNKDGKKMYDIEINVYNSLDKVEKEDFAYLILIKSSNMLNPTLQLVSEPLYSDLAESLIQETQDRLNPTPTPELEGDINVSGPDVESNEDSSEGE